MSWPKVPVHWFVAWAVFGAGACQDRPLNLLPDSFAGAPAGGTPTLGNAAPPSSGTGGVAVSDGPGGGSSGTAGLAGAVANVGGGGSSGQGGAAIGGFNGGGDAGMAGASSGTGGGISCSTDADCASPTPGCSPSAHVCKKCSKDSQCPSGQKCSLDDGECGN